MKPMFIVRVFVWFFTVGAFWFAISNLTMLMNKPNTLAVVAGTAGIFLSLCLFSSATAFLIGVPLSRAAREIVKLVKEKRKT